jgi:hypothetical protein
MDDPHGAGRRTSCTLRSPHLPLSKENLGVVAFVLRLIPDAHRIPSLLLRVNHRYLDPHGFTSRRSASEKPWTACLQAA